MLVRPTTSFVSTAIGRDIILGPADVLADDDPHVKAYPEMFTPVRVTVRGGTTHVEEATARPGEKRNR